MRSIPVSTCVGQAQVIPRHNFAPPPQQLQHWEVQQQFACGAGVRSEQPRSRAGSLSKAPSESFSTPGPILRPSGAYQSVPTRYLGETQVMASSSSSSTVRRMVTPVLIAQTHMPRSSTPTLSSGRMSSSPGVVVATSVPSGGLLQVQGMTPNVSATKLPTWEATAVAVHQQLSDTNDSGLSPAAGSDGPGEDVAGAGSSLAAGWGSDAASPATKEAEGTARPRQRSKAKEFHPPAKVAPRQKQRSSSVNANARLGEAPEASLSYGSPRDDRKSSYCAAAGGRVEYHSPPRRSSSQADLAQDPVRRGAMTSRDGGRDLASDAKLRKELDDLKAEHVKLQDKLCKARNLVALLHRQVEEARAERDKEHKRSEGLQFTINQLQKQLKRELARAQLLERNALATSNGGGGANTDRANTPNRRVGVVLETEDPAKASNGFSGVQGVYSSSSDFGTGSRNTPRGELSTALVEGTPRCRGGSPPRSATAAAIVAPPGAASTPSAPMAVASAQRPPSAGSRNSPLSNALPPEAEATSRLEHSHDRSNETIHGEAIGGGGGLSGGGAEKSWEFVVQGQLDPYEHQDFASKMVTCFPDDAVERAWERGVVSICCRGRRAAGRTVPNQDDFLIARHSLANDGYIALYGVFDGHGPAGHQCAAFVRGSLPEKLFGQQELLVKPELTLREAFSETQQALLRQTFDTATSGTTAAVALVLNITDTSAAKCPGTSATSSTIKGEAGCQAEAWLFVAHVGDSRIVLATKREDEESSFAVTPLTRDHRPDDVEEAERIRSAGGEVRKLNRTSGPMRVFLPNQDAPAMALTRSLGASSASAAGVLSDPETAAYRLRPNVDVLLLLGTDGLFEFCSNTDATSRILNEGCSLPVLEDLCLQSRKMWAQTSYNETVDDITAVAVSLCPTSVSPPAKREVP